MLVTVTVNKYDILIRLKEIGDLINLNQIKLIK